MHQIQPVEIQIIPIRGRKRIVTVLGVTGPGAVPALALQDGKRKHVMPINQIKSASEVASGHAFDSPQQLFEIMQQRMTDAVQLEPEALQELAAAKPASAAAPVAKSNSGCLKIVGIGLAILLLLSVIGMLIPNPLEGLPEAEQLQYRHLEAQLRGQQMPLTADQAKRRIGIYEELLELDRQGVPDRVSERQIALDAARAALPEIIAREQREAEQRAAELEAELAEIKSPPGENRLNDRRRIEILEELSRWDTRFADPLEAARREITAANAAEVKRLEGQLQNLDPEKATLEQLRAEQGVLEKLSELDDTYTSRLQDISQAVVLRVEKDRQQQRAMAEVAEYSKQLDLEMPLVEKMVTTKLSGDVETIKGGLILISAWALIYEKGEDLPLDSATATKRRRFRNALVRQQSKLLPAMRDAYGPALRKELWIADGSARTIGRGYRIIELVAPEFVRNANIQSAHQVGYETYMMLRFTEARYKWFAEASRYTSYSLDPPKDTDIVVWTGHRFRVLK